MWVRLTVGRGRHLLLTLAVLGGTLAVTEHPTSAQNEPALESILDLAAKYVVGFREQLSGIVAEEHYQQMVRSPTSARAQFGGFRRERRELRSDFLLVRPEGQDHYFEFRDVFEVDGQPVRGREERLSRLFLDPSGSSARQIQQITTESARYNIGTIERTLNTPTLALLLLDPRYQPTVKFALTTESTPTLDLDMDAVDSTGEVYAVEFVEQGQDTLVRGQRNTRLASVGRFWIDGTTGVVVASELVVDAPGANAVVDVRFGLEPSIGSQVPVEMRELYEGPRDGTRIEGTATYSRFRQFQVQVAEGEQLTDVRD